MNLEQLSNLKEGSYIWLQFGRMRIGDIAKVISVRNYPVRKILIYSKREGNDNLINLWNIGYNVVPLDSLDSVDPQKLKESCYIVIESIHKEGLDKYTVDVFHELKGNNVLYLNGHEFRYDPLKYKIYQIPVSYF